MKIGICTQFENITEMEKIGFDYIEPSVAGLNKMDNKMFSNALSVVNNSNIKCEAFNVLFPAEIKLTGNYVKKEKIEEYIKFSFEKVALLGGKIVVFGSANSRNVPEGFEKYKAYEQLIEAAFIVGNIAKEFSITIAMEPLNKGESNILNSVLEGLEFVKTLDHENVKLLADFYHMRTDNEDISFIKSTGGYLQHTHIARGVDRKFPSVHNEDLYNDFFNSLEVCGYKGRVSIEGKSDNLIDDAKIALKLLRGICM